MSVLAYLHLCVRVIINVLGCQPYSVPAFQCQCQCFSAVCQRLRVSCSVLVGPCQC